MKYMDNHIFVICMAFIGLALRRAIQSKNPRNRRTQHTASLKRALVNTSMYAQTQIIYVECLLQTDKMYL